LVVTESRHYQLHKQIREAENEDSLITLEKRAAEEDSTDVMDRAKDALENAKQKAQDAFEKLKKKHKTPGIK